MELLSERFLNSDICKLVSGILKYSYIYKEKVGSFEDFKLVMKTFIETIMKNYLSDLDFCDRNYSVMITENSCHPACFINIENTIQIREDIIKELYNGEVRYLLVVFHELNHFKVDCDIKKGIINEDLIKIVKEKLLRENFYKYTSAFKKGLEEDEDIYYQYNYDYYTEELIVEINGINDIMKLLKQAEIEITDSDYKVLCGIYEDSENKLKDDKRDFQFLLSGSIEDYNCVFNSLIKYNQEWLSYPQIAQEYYIDDNNKVLKKVD